MKEREVRREEGGKISLNVAGEGGVTIGIAYWSR
jgi:hypothetical protein